MFSVVILAAGNSSRMKQAKALLKFDKNTVFIEHIVAEYLQHKLCNELVVVVNSKLANILQNYMADMPKLKITVNHYPEKERFYSIQCGMKALTHPENIFLHNADNPFVKQKTLDELILRIKGFDFAVPQYQGNGGHPILLSSGITSDIITEKNTNQNLKDYLKRYKKIYVPVKDKNILVNINSKNDYQQMFGAK
jgi:molybdenum cofactor cytidylyltransferase